MGSRNAGRDRGHRGVLRRWSTIEAVEHGFDNKGTVGRIATGHLNAFGALPVERLDRHRLLRGINPCFGGFGVVERGVWIEASDPLQRFRLEFPIGGLLFDNLLERIVVGDTTGARLHDQRATERLARKFRSPDLDPLQNSSVQRGVGEACALQIGRVDTEQTRHRRAEKDAPTREALAKLAA